MNSSKLKIFISILLTFFTYSIYSQVPQGFNYQGVARDAEDKVISDDFISLRIALVEGSSNGNVVYLETHQNVSTSPQGVFSLIVGGGATNDDFSNVDWPTSAHFLRVDMDINNGTNYERMGTSQLLSVPYAIHAGSAATEAGNNSDEDSDPTNEIQDLELSGNTLSISGGNSVELTDQVNDSDADPANEIQNLSINGNQLSISGGNTVDLPVPNGTEDNWGTQVVESDGSISGDGTAGDPLSVEGDLTDDQSLTVIGNQLSISGGNTVNLPVPSGAEDNWGTQVVESDGSISGDGTSGNPLSVNGDLTDDQNLSISGDQLSISAGNTITLPDNVIDADSDPTNELITNMTLSGNNLTIEETSQVRLVDLSPLLTGSAALWQLSGNNIFYDTGEVIFGNPTVSNTYIGMNSNTFRINGIEGTEVTFDTEKLRFDPIGFTPSLGSASYRRNGFEIFSGSGLETRLTDALLEIIEGDNTAHLQPDNLHFHTTTGDGMIYGNGEINGNFRESNVRIHPAQGEWSFNNFNTLISANGVLTTYNDVGLGLGVFDNGGAIATLSTIGTDLLIYGNNVGFNTANPQLEVHITEKDNDSFQLFLENGNNKWSLGAQSGTNNLLFKLNSNNNFSFLDGNTLSFGAISDKRAKKNIRTQPDVLNQMMALKVKQFEYIGSDVSTVGLIAQDVENVFPALVKEFKVNTADQLSENSPKYESLLGLNYTQLTFLNTKAIQEQQTIINNQKEEINELKELMLEMQKQIEELKN